RLPSPAARRPLPFRHAVHTLILDETTAQLAAGAGFDTVVQVFPWRDLNPEQGRYTWDVADGMVVNARRYGLDLVVRLDMPPAWAVRPVTAGVPFDLAAYADFVGATAARYRDHVLAYIIWNEPNLAAEWSRSGGDLPSHWSAYDGWVADPADYVGVVGVAYERIRAADPGALVVAGGLAPTNEFSPRAMDDREFLRQMYAGGPPECFHVLAVHDYGYGLSPEAGRETQDGLNLARVEDIQAIMATNGDDRPVWITELGYTIQPGQHPAVSATQQATYLLGAFRRVQRDWPWIEMLAVWNLVYGRPPGDEMSGYSLVNSDLTPRPAYQLLQEMLHQPLEATGARSYPQPSPAAP
ncbi:MAG: glycoside hydrolase family 5 protein, partial [Chloroflexi bacterium]|nr:glycoside hydrolase family 5 protein [Chloroflexota bacterium]